jgi:hypothetical protein
MTQTSTARSVDQLRTNYESILDSWMAVQKSAGASRPSVPYRHAEPLARLRFFEVRPLFVRFPG